jgi:hypothetical protein
MKSSKQRSSVITIHHERFKVFIVITTGVVIIVLLALMLLGII